MEWKILGQVLWHVFGTITVVVLAILGVIFAIDFLGIWSLLIVPLIVLFYVIKSMYEDELVRQGKRLH